VFIYFRATVPTHRPTPALVACRFRPLPSVCSIIRRLLTSRCWPPPPPCNNIAADIVTASSSSPRALSSLVTHRAVHRLLLPRQPPLLVLPNNAAPPLLRLLLCTLIGLVDRVIRCGSIRAGPRGRRHFVRSSSRANEIDVLHHLRLSLIV